MYMMCLARIHRYRRTQEYIARRTAKGLAYARRLPLVPVNHLEGHVAALSGDA